MIRIAVTDSSAVAEARRRASELADWRGFDEGDTGRIKLVVTELATNILKHGGDSGDILVGEFEDAGVSGVEILALDSGPGITDLQSCLADGYSSTGTPGNGLGAIFRQSQFVDVASWPGLGTAVLARIEPGKRDIWDHSATQRTQAEGSGSQGSSSRCGAVRVPMPGEEICGDDWCVDTNDGDTTFLLADGLGHGPQAAAASAEAVQVFKRHRAHSVTTLLEYVHGGLRATRGAAIAIARVHRGIGKVEFGGIGNIAGAIVSEHAVKRMVSMAGTAGHNARKIQSFDYAFGDDLLILHSDGLSTSWSLDRYPGLASMHPTLIAGVLYRDFWRQRDDVTVVVMRGGTGA